MARVQMLALLGLVSAILRADTIELKTGEHIEGKIKQTNSTGAVIEVGGQSITIPSEKVQAIYFGSGAVSNRTHEAAPSREGMDALRALQSVVESGIAYRDYASRVLDAKVKIDRYLASPAENTELPRRIRAAMMLYELARQTWLTKITGFSPNQEFADLQKSMGNAMEDPEIATCAAVKMVVTWHDAPPTPRKPPKKIIPSPPSDRESDLGMAVTIWEMTHPNLAPGLWSCASAEISEAASLDTAAPAGAPTATAQLANSNPLIQEVIRNSEAARGSDAAAASLATVGRVLSQEELTDLIQKGQASRCSVVTVPPGAEVDIDANKMGISPIVFVLLRRGDAPRTLTIKMSGYKTVEKSFVPDGKAISLGLTLERK